MLLLILSAAITLAFSNVLMSVGLRAINSVKSLAKNKFWLGGILLSIVGTLLYYATMAKYDISMAQPFMALCPALTALLGWKFLGEKITRKITLAIILVFCGLLINGTLAVNVVEDNSKMPSEEMLWIYAGAILALLIVFCLIFRKAEVTDSLCAGAGFGLTTVFYKSIALDGLFPPPIDLRIFTFALLYLAAFLCTQVGLRRGRALFVIPLSAAVGSLTPIIGGILVFGETAFLVQKIVVIILIAIGLFLFVRE